MSAAAPDVRAVGRTYAREMVSGYLLAVGCIFGVNLLPAFGPPTWAVLVFFRLNSQLAAVPLVLLGALAAASGRLVLAATTRRFRSRFSRRRLESLEAAEDALVGSRGKAVAGLGLFALSRVLRGRAQSSPPATSWWSRSGWRLVRDSSHVCE
jgi:hypothetical protein